jgi:RIO kinase 1
MGRKNGFDLEDEAQEHQHYQKIKGKQGSAGKPHKKQSYESNADVQRWLQLQSLKEDDLSKAAFNPTFLAGRRDASWILSSLTDFYEQDLITDVLHAVKSGKEASVYCCVAHPSTGLDYVAAKIYRPRMFRSLSNDAIYRQGRTQRDIDGRIVHNGRHHQDAFKSERGRAAQISFWIDYEFQTQHLISLAGADVPRPLAHIGNAVLMEYVGEVDEPAPLLQEVTLTREEAEPLFKCILRNVELFLGCNRVHGDLSAYNILYWRGAVKLIDFAQAVDPGQSQDVFPLLVRDIERVCRYFARYGIVSDAYTLAADMWRRYQGSF